MSATTSRRCLLLQGAQGFGLLTLAGKLAPALHAADEPIQAGSSTSDVAKKLTERGIAFLRPRQDSKGGWSTQREPGITSLVVTALYVRDRSRAADPMVIKALTYLESFIGPTGGLSEAPHANYSTSIALLAFREANVKGRYDRTIKAGQEFLKSMQWDESEGKSRGDAFYGGAGYGGSNSRPDLSNTTFFIDALAKREYLPMTRVCKKRLCLSLAVKI